MPENVPVEQLVTVTVSISVPTTPDTAMVLVVLNVRLEDAPPPVPTNVLIDMGVAAPAPRIKVTPSERVTAPAVIWPVEVPPKAEEPVTDMGVLKFMTPVPAAVIMPFNVMLDGAVAVTPAVKAMVAPPPKVRVPVLENVTALVIVPPPLKATLYPWAAVLRVPMVAAPENVMVPVVLVSVAVLAPTVE